MKAPLAPAGDAGRPNPFVVGVAKNKP